MTIMKERQCTFEIHHVENEYVERILLSLSDDRSPGTDNLDSKLLRITAKYISTPICHIFKVFRIWCVPGYLERGKGHSTA